jgi:beta-galactosidase
MNRKLTLIRVLVMLGLPAVAAAATNVYTVTVTAPAPATSEGFKMGTSRHPDGSTLTLDSNSLLFNGKPFTPVMGEFHFSRYPDNEWREELLKMKAGGVDIVATYVFWIHHEEIEGQFDWSGCRNLRRFVELSGEAGLKVIVRCGPWDHGEVRNGGLPDWLLKKGWKTRSNDTNYLAKAKILYGQIARQIGGLLWKDGGPVIGVQVDNEYRGPAEHLLALKQLARDVGLDVPLYTRTGWPALTTPMPFGEIVPLYGVYAEGFWDRELTPMPGRYWSGFHFSTLRTDANIANEILGRSEAKDAPDVAKYPYLTCEIGGGMMSSYHRRIRVNPADIDSTTLVKLGSGSTSPGYYMYHGGVNPEGKLTTLQESQATEYWNDLPVKNYDFQAPLGQYGQVRPQYHTLRRLHLFLRDFGSQLAGMPPFMPDHRPTGRDDVNTLRWSVRSDGRSGFVFVNNYERLRELPVKTNVQFAVKLPGGTMSFPETPITVRSGARFFWPFNLDLGKGVVLRWATAQPVCSVDSGNRRTVFLMQTEGVPVEVAFDGDREAKTFTGEVVRRDQRVVVKDMETGTGPAIRFTVRDRGAVEIVVLSEAEALSIWKGDWKGQPRVFHSRADLLIDGVKLRLTSTNAPALYVGMHPRPENVTSGERKLLGMTEGVFEYYTPAQLGLRELKASYEPVQAAGAARDIPMGKIRQPVAAAPEDADFEKAAVWKIKLPADLDLNSNPILRIKYIGDVARVTLDGKLLTDNFYNGNALEVGIRRHAPDIFNGDLRIAILPLRKDAPVYMAKAAKPDFGDKESVVKLEAVEIIAHYQVELQ